MRKYRKFAEGGTSALDELASGREKGSFDEDVYARAKKFLERGGSEAPSRPAKARVPVSAEPVMGRPRGESVSSPEPTLAAPRASADIPGAGPYRAPVSTGEMMGETERNIRNILSATTPGLARGAARGAEFVATPIVKGVQAGRGDAAIAREIERAAGSAPASAVRTTMPRTAESGRKFTGKQEVEAAESTMRGATSRRKMREQRAERARGQAEVMERNKPVLQATPKKPSPRSRTRDEEVDYELRAKGGRIGYAKGGSVRGGGCEQRGKTKGRFV